MIFLFNWVGFLGSMSILRGVLLSDQKYAVYIRNYLFNMYFDDNTWVYANKNRSRW